MADKLDDAIAENAVAPRKASGDSGSVEQHSLTEQIEADRYLAAKKAVKSKNGGLHLHKLLPPGSA